MERPLTNEEERNWLAQLRTLMANERTLMAYYRTSFAIIGVAVFIYKFYDEIVFRYLSGIFVICGFLLAFYGTIRYKKFIRKIKNDRTPVD